jgi:hypothetical protein
MLYGWQRSAHGTRSPRGPNSTVWAGGAMPPAMVSRGYRNAVGVATLAYFTDAKIK